MNTVASKVFGCDDLRMIILSYIPKRCKSCHKKMNTKPLKLSNLKISKKGKLLGYLNYNWRESECAFLKGYCNWCYYYVFEYR